MEHPMITQVNRIGYPTIVAQPEHAGIDYFDTEILAGDEVAEDEDGNIVLVEDLKKFLSEVYGFKFYTAE